MADEAMKKVLDLKHAILVGVITGLLSVLGVTASTSLLVGSYRQKVDTMQTDLADHLKNYEPNKSADYQTTKTDVAVLKIQVAALEKSLDDIKAQNSTIIKLVRGNKGLNE